MFGAYLPPDNCAKFPGDEHGANAPAPPNPAPMTRKRVRRKCNFAMRPKRPLVPSCLASNAFPIYCGEEKGKKSARKGGKGGVLFRGTGAGAAARNVGQSRLCGARNVRGALRRNRISGARAYALPERSAWGRWTKPPVRSAQRALSVAAEPYQWSKSGTAPPCGARFRFCGAAPPPVRSALRRA